MVGAMFLMNNRDGVSHNYYTYNFQSDNLSSSVLFRLLDNILNALKSFRLYKVALRIGTDLLLMVGRPSAVGRLIGNGCL